MGDRVGLAVVRSLDRPRRLVDPVEIEEFEQELVDQYLLAAIGAGAADSTVIEDRSAIQEKLQLRLVHFSLLPGRPLFIWAGAPMQIFRESMVSRKTN